MTTPGRSELKILDPEDNDAEYHFPIAPDQNGAKLMSIETSPWQPGDAKQEFRVPLHPWDGGLSQNRIDYKLTFAGNLVNTPSRNYAKANADASWPNILIPPPLLTTLNFQIASSTSFAYTRTHLMFAGTPVAPALSVGPGTKGVFAGTPTGTPLSVPGPAYFSSSVSASGYYMGERKYRGKSYLFGGQYLVSLTGDYTVTLVKDFGAGKRIYDIEVHNDFLIIALGETDKIWSMDSGETFTEAVDNTFAIALGRVGEFLYRAETINRISSCTSAPRTLASWTPAGSAAYVAGDTTYPIVDIIEYTGFPVAIKRDGVYFPDGQSIYHNQTPQLATYPHTDNGKGAFVAWGYLWVPSAIGLLRITQGESIPYGPEKSNRPGYRFWIRAGVEWSGDIYLLCNDQAVVAQTAIFKMSLIGGQTVKFDEIARTGSTDLGFFITVATQFENPSVVFGQAGGAKYFKLGRGGGRHIDDPNYAYGTSWEFETGDCILGPDLGVESYIVGVDVVVRAAVANTLTLSYELDNTGTFSPMYSFQEGTETLVATTANVSSATYSVVTRYAAKNVSGQLFNFKLAGTNVAITYGTDHSEVREMWAFGYSHPRVTDTILLGIYADSHGKVNGLGQGRTAGETERLFRRWMYDGTMLNMYLRDYEEYRDTLVRVIDVKVQNISTRIENSERTERTDVVSVALRRTDFSGRFAVEG